mmetsp:Transcript_21294/g.36463  ORF Transcript_21294/g.36463 Transcript_21294/m.36463 type:complete len:694 (+) Transcript_21294:142-2223(+)
MSVDFELNTNTNIFEMPQDVKPVIEMMKTFDTTATSSTANDTPFTLPPNFIRKYSNMQPDFGFSGLGEMVYKRTYSRLREDGTNEKWYQTVERVVNGTFNMQKKWTKSHMLQWNAEEQMVLAKDMYRRIFEMKFLPPGRGLWAMGSALTEEKELYAALNNCAFVSTEGMEKNPSQPFTFLMDASMLGVGVGFDTVGAKSFVVKGISETASSLCYQIPDSREGWVESLKHLLNSYFYGYAPVEFDYSLIRLAGEPIRGFGGVSSGPQCLKDLHKDVRDVLSKNTGKPITVTSIVDIMNLIGRCVVAGNLRRTAEIAFGNADDEEYINLKNYEVNPHRMAYGWTSNNSVFAKLGMDYTNVCKIAATNGEPGFCWLDNMQKYDRMNGVVTNTDHRAKGGNPCLEQTLESYEMCCLVETFPNKHETLQDYIETLRVAYLYAKTVTLGRTHWPETNQVMLRNRRIGTSMSGIAQFIASKGQEALREWCEEGYDAIQRFDKEFSDKFAVPTSIKTTSIKPSGTVSLLAGATPGVHYPISRYYQRRVRLAADSELVTPLQEAGYPIEPAVGNPGTMVVSFPVDAGEGLRKVKEVSMWEQLGLAAFLQKHWADNQVSCTVTFDPETEGHQMKHALDIYQYQLKGISFLPHCDGVYPQMPYEEITKEEYETMKSNIVPIRWADGSSYDPQAERFCDGDHCTL